jgi:photosystem II stability/assembly factor-like uncharacterized protein
MTMPFVAPEQNLRTGFTGETAISFIDETHGRLLLFQISGAAHRVGALFGTSDGGQTWSLLPYPPTAGRIMFTSTNTSWLQGGSRSVFL